MVPTALIADPDPFSQQQLVALLQPGFRCVVARTLHETAQLILRERPTLLVLELDQPDGDGIAFVSYLHARPDLQHILIACVTWRGSIKDKIAAFRAGADDYLLKPLTIQQNFFGRMLLLQRSGHLARAVR